MDQFSLRWNNYLNEVTDAFYSLRSDDDLIDVTLSCEGRKLKAHKVLLSACSSYFRDIFKENPCQHPVIVFRNIKYADLEAVIDYIYRGEVSVDQSQLESFLGIAQLLEVKGLSDGQEKDGSDEEEDSVVKDVGTSEPVACAQPLKARTPASPPMKKRKIASRRHAKRPPTVVQNPLIKPEPEEYIEHVSFVEVDTYNIKEEQLSIMDESTSENSAQNVVENQQINKPAHSTDRPSRGAAVTSVEAEIIGHGDLNEGKAVTSDVQNNLKLSKVMSTVVQPVKSRVKSAKVTAKEIKDSVAASKRRRIKVESVQATQQTNLEQPDVKPLLTKGNVHIPKGLTVSVMPVKYEMNMNLGDSHNVQPSDEDAVLRSENARTPVGEEICGFQSQLTKVEFTASDQIEQEEPEMGEEAPQVESEQATADVPEEEEEEPAFDYYGCEICKAEAKACDRLTFTHKCPICPCMCFCSHLLKEHMRVIHGWFNVQRKFTQNY